MQSVITSLERQAAVAIFALIKPGKLGQLQLNCKAPLMRADVLQAKPSMTKSSVVDNETGKSVDSTVRTSTGTFFSRGQDEVVAAIEKRIAQVSMQHSCLL